MDHAETFHVVPPDMDNLWAAVRLLPSFVPSFSPVVLPDLPEAFPALRLLVATACIEVRCRLQAENPAAGQRLDAELRFCGCVCDPFTTDGKRRIAWHAFDHAGWLNPDGAVATASEIALNFSVRRTDKGDSVLLRMQNLKEFDIPEEKLAATEEVLMLLTPREAAAPQIVSCSKVSLSESAQRKATDRANPAEPDATDFDKGGVPAETGQPFLITLCSGIGRDASYIDRENIAAGTGVSTRTIASYDELTKKRNPPSRNGTVWAGVAVMAYAPNSAGTISKREIALYDMHMVRSFFGKIDTTKIRPRNVFLVPEKRP